MHVDRFFDMGSIEQNTHGKLNEFLLVGVLGVTIRLIDRSQMKSENWVPKPKVDLVLG